MNDLFPIPETPSPRLLWMKKHWLTVNPMFKKDGTCGYIVYSAATRIADADTELNALTKAAKSLGLRLWNEGTAAQDSASKTNNPDVSEL